ncbi:MAG: hypothetical protein OHK0013_48510 [Sandaracinaceae bacterium]
MAAAAPPTPPSSAASRVRGPSQGAASRTGERGREGSANRLELVAAGHEPEPARVETRAEPEPAEPEPTAQTLSGSTGRLRSGTGAGRLR